MFFRITPNLYFPNDGSKESALVNKAIQDKHYLLEMLDDVYLDTSISKKSFIQNMPFPYSVIEIVPLDNVRNSLSRILRILHQYLFKNTSKHFMVIIVNSFNFSKLFVFIAVWMR